MLQAIQAWDEAALLFIREHLCSPVLNTVMTAITYLDEAGAIWIAIGLILLLFKKTRIAGLDVLLALGLCYLLNDFLIKPLIARPRPWVAIEGFDSLIRHPSGTSFPSGHALTSFSSAYAAAKRLGKKGAWCFLPAALIAISRPWLGVHFITDILAGAAIGVLGAMLVLWLREKILPLEKKLTPPKEAEE